MVSENKALIFNFTKKILKQKYFYDQKRLKSYDQILQAVAILDKKLKISIRFFNLDSSFF